MTTIARGIALVAAALMVGACSPSGYSLQARNNLQQPVELRILAQKKDAEARTLEAPQIAPGANFTISTKAEHDEKVRLEARVVGDAASAPAVYPMMVGLSKVVIGPNPDAGKDEKAPKVRVREDR